MIAIFIDWTVNHYRQSLLQDAYFLSEFNFNVLETEVFLQQNTGKMRVVVAAVKNRPLH